MTLVFSAQVKAVPLGSVRLRLPSIEAATLRGGGALKLAAEEAAARRRAPPRMRCPPSGARRGGARSACCPVAWPVASAALLASGCRAGPAAGAGSPRGCAMSRRADRSGRRGIGCGDRSAAGDASTPRLDPSAVAAPGRVVTSRTGASSGEATFGPPDAGAPAGAPNADRLGQLVGRRHQRRDARRRVRPRRWRRVRSGISSLRGSGVAAVGLVAARASSPRRRPSCRSPTKRWIVNAATATSEPISSDHGQQALLRHAMRCARGDVRECRARRAAARSCCRRLCVGRPVGHRGRCGSFGSCVMAWLPCCASAGACCRP